jgi:hypothetical protein
LNKTKIEFLKELREAKDEQADLHGALHINVLIKDQKFKIFCGEGKQKIRWLTDVAIFRYKKATEAKCGIAFSVKMENGSLCDLEDSINTVLSNNENVWVLLKEEYEVYLQEQEKKILNSKPLEKRGSLKNK